MVKEVWRDIKGYEGYYKVSNLGNVKSVDRVINNGGVKYTAKGKLLKLQHNGHGYYQVSLSKKGKRKSYKVHRLVAEAFIPNTRKLNHINHIDGNKLNNNVTNLEWVTQQENNQHAWDKGLNKNTAKQRETAKQWCKENRDKMVKGMQRVRVKCLNNGKVYNSITEASEDLGIEGKYISRVALGQRNHTFGYKFERLD